MSPEAAPRGGAEEKLKELLGFESLLANISSRFVNLLPLDVDREIEQALKVILDFFRVDRVGLVRAMPEKNSFQVTHVVYSDTVPPVPAGVELPMAIHPWSSDKLMRNQEVVAFPRIDDAPPEADVDKKHLPKEKHPNQGMQMMWSTLQMTGYTFPVRSATPWKTLQREVFYWEPKGDQNATWIARVKNEDAVDYWYRNNAGFNYNINAELKRIKARTLVVHVVTDQWLMIENARKAAQAVPGAAFATLSDPQAHYGETGELAKTFSLDGV